MNNETKIITMMDEILSRSHSKKTKLYESDSELFIMNSRKYLWTIDDFSAEDFFRTDDPEILGWNLAAATISDIYACAGIVKFYSHSVVLDKNWNNDFIKKFAKGVKKALDYSGAEFIAGDTGVSNEWKYTATVIGTAPAKRLSRKGAKPGDKIFMTGKIGAGNVQAILELTGDPRKIKIKFPIRREESVLTGKYASSCIDTSDGVINALGDLSRVNGTGYSLLNPVFIERGFPELLLLLGECGEYELLFTVNPKNEKNILSETQRRGLKFYCIGEITESEKILNISGKQIDLSDFNIRARDFEDIESYLDSLKAYIKERG